MSTGNLERHARPDPQSTHVVLVDGEIRGEPIRLWWEDGMVSGDIHLLDRVRMHLELSAPQGADHRPDFTDPVEFMDALRLVFEDRVSFTIDPGDSR